MTVDIDDYQQKGTSNNPNQQQGQKKKRQHAFARPFPVTDKDNATSRASSSSTPSFVGNPSAKDGSTQQQNEREGRTDGNSHYGHVFSAFGERYKAAICQSLDSYAYDNAIFLARRLYAEDPCEENMLLLSTCFMKNNQANRAYLVLRGKCQSLESRFLFAKCCLQLNKLREAELCLIKDLEPGSVTLAKLNLDGEAERFNATSAEHFEVLGDHQEMDPTVSSSTERNVGFDDMKNGRGGGIGGHGGSQNDAKGHRKDKESTCDDFLGDTTGFGYALLGDICRKANRIPQACVYYRKSLEINPFLWSSYEALCQCDDASIDPFQVFDPQRFEIQHMQPTVRTYSGATHSNSGDNKHEYVGEKANRQLNLSIPCTPSADKSLGEPLMNLSFVLENSTPKVGSLGLSSFVTPSPSSFTTPLNLHSAVKMQGPPPVGGGLGSEADAISTGSKGPLGRRKEGDETSVKLSGRLFVAANENNGVESIAGLDQSKDTGRRSIGLSDPMSPGSAKKKGRTFSGKGLGNAEKKPRINSALSYLNSNARTNATSQNVSSKLKTTASTRTRSGKTPLTGGLGRTDENEYSSSDENMCRPKRAIPSDADSCSENPAKTYSLGKENLNSIDTDYAEQQMLLNTNAMNHLCTLGLALKEMCTYNCEECLEVLNELPLHHFETGWVLALAGRAFFEMVKYTEAENVFATMRHREPYHIEGCEIYSTVLWHLRKEKELSFLAHELVGCNKTSPEAWCAVGNCFSLQKEHESALKFFERAVQVRPDFTYAYTLLGHEYVYNEDFEKALGCYRNAIRTDGRHYNAWYGLGMIYYRQEKYELAEYHFRKALSINPRSTVLYCYIGMVLHARKRSILALEFLNQALLLNACNPLVKFNKAIVLFSLDRTKEALEELEELQTVAPKESAVLFLMGKIYKRMGHANKAFMYYSWAMDLDPKGTNNMIKEAIDKHQLPDDEDDAPEPIHLSG